MDLVGERFGKLVVLERIGRDKYYDAIWRCKCDCGNIVDVRQGHLRSGHTKSCGCEKFQLKSLVGKRFGSLMVISRADDYVTPSTGKRYVQWNCRCDCGNDSVVLTQNLVNGNIKSCGCKSPHKLQSLTGKRFGRLLVLEQVAPYINGSGRKLIRYKCQCDCGNVVYCLANTLRVGDVNSCGCMNTSKGEMLVKDWLDNEQVIYEFQKTFDDCLSDKNYKLRYDFYLPSKNTLIECNGIQHYKIIDFFGGEERFLEQQRNDFIKQEYARNNGYNFIVLDCRKHNISNILDELSDFLVLCSDKANSLR